MKKILSFFWCSQIFIWSIAPTFLAASPQLEREGILTIRGLFSDHLYELAIAESGAFLQSYPQSEYTPEARYVMATAQFQLGNYQEALDEFGRFEQRHPSSPYLEDVMFFKAASLFNTGSFRKANETNELLLIRFPKTKYKRRVQIRRPKFLYQLERYQQVVNTFELYQSLKLFSEKDGGDWADMQIYYAFSLDEIGRDEEAKPLILERLKKARNEKEKILLDLRLIRMEKSDAKLRENYALVRKLKDYYEEPEILDLIEYESVLVFFQWDQNSEETDPEYRLDSMKFLQRRIDASETPSPKDLFMLAWFHKKNGQLDHAKKGFLTLRNEYPEFSKKEQVSLRLAEIYRELGDETGASVLLEESLEQVTEVDEKKRLSLKLAKYYLDKNQPSKALEYLSGAEHGEAGQAPVRYHFLKASAHYLMGDYFIAANHYFEIPEDADEYPLIFNEFLLSLAKSDRVEEFLAFFKDRFETIPENKRTEAFQIKINLYFAQGMCDRILEEKNEIVAFQPGIQKDAHFQKFLGDCHLSKNNAKKFEEHYWNAFDLYSDEESEQKLAVADKLSSHFLKIKNFKKLIGIYQASIPLIKDPRLLTKSILFLGKIWDKELSNPKEAIKWYSDIHLKNDFEENFEASYLLGEIYIRQNQLKSALFILGGASEKLKTTSAWYTVINHRIGQIHHNREDLQLALKFYRAAVRKKEASPERKDALKQIGVIKKYLKSVRQ